MPREIKQLLFVILGLAVSIGFFAGWLGTKSIMQGFILAGQILLLVVGLCLLLIVLIWLSFQVFK